MLDCVTLGDSTLDTFLVIDEATVHCDLNREHCQLCLNYAEKIPIRESHQSVGGNAANIAVGLTRLGLKTTIVTELGDDVTGDIIRETLDAASVDTSLIKIIRGGQTRYSVVLNYQAERTILTYHAPRRYQLTRLPQTRWLYYTSLGPQFERLHVSLLQLLKKRPEIKLAANPGSYQLKNRPELMRQLLPHLDVLFVNKEEAVRLIGKEQTIPKLLSGLLKHGARLVVITDSLNGSYGSGGETTCFMPTFPIKPIAKTGAGDAYASGFLAARILGQTLPQAMRWGTANASGVIQKWGAQNGLLTRRQLQKQIDRFRTITAREM